MKNYEAEILALLSERGLGKTICPSELLIGDDKKNPILMEEVRASARELIKNGKIEMTQKGRVVDPYSVRGPIRLRLKTD